MPASRRCRPSAEGILLAAPRAGDYALLQRSLDELVEQARERHEDRALALLAALVPEYGAAAPASPRAAAEELSTKPRLRGKRRR